MVPKKTFLIICNIKIDLNDNCLITKHPLFHQELEDLKASTARGNQRVRNFKRKIELAEQKTDRLQNVSVSIIAEIIIFIIS